jgi:hypothetical protein
MDRRISVHITSVVLEQIELMFMVLVAMHVLHEIQRPVGGIDERQVGFSKASGVLHIRGGGRVR